jgi:lysophospholipase L1-like esterase
LKSSMTIAVVSGLFVAGMLGTAGAPAIAGAPPTVVDYVALGDSYAAGVGSGPTEGACRIAAGAYPRLWTATDDKAVSLTQAACSGASTADVAGKQLGRLGDDTDLVTVTVGANDLALVDAVAVCADPRQEQACLTALATIRTSLATTLPGALSKAVTAVRAKAPRAKLAVVGYPLPFENVADCPAVPLPKAARDAGNALVAGLNQALGAAAASAGGTFVDVTGHFAGHGLCSTEPWLIGPEGIADATALHPTRAGQEKAYLPALTKAVGSPSAMAAWIAGRDPKTPSATPSADALPTSGAGAPGAGTDGQAGGAEETLPITGTNVWWMAGLGLAVLIIGAVAYRLFAPRRIRTVSE